jgi:quinol monooxygenase YgiN
MIVQTAKIQVAEGKGKEFEKEYQKVAMKVRKDPGTLEYVLHRDNGDPCKFLFIEKYENEAAMKYHSSELHVKEFIKMVDPMTIGKPEISLYTVV